MKLNFKKDATTFMNEVGEFVERLSMDIDGHDVQILRYDGNNRGLLVMVDRAMGILPLNQVDAFIRGRLEG